jgi:murein DD-endopeptidase MepM/ murein hydrolase activator NlpD
MDVSTARARDAQKFALGASIFTNIILIAVLLWPAAEPAEVPAPTDDEHAAGEVEPDPAEPPPEAVAEPAAPVSDVQAVAAKIEGSIPQTMADIADPYGDEVSATMSRVLVWDLDLRRDLRAGDKVETMWSLGSSDKVIIEAVRYHAQKHGKTIAGYRFQASGDEYPSYWSADGTEVPHRLKKSPLAKYEQVTSLLKDRPTHHGMDFKVAVGTEVVTPFAGVVTRANWNWKANGNCVEIQHADGVLAKYLHLSKNTVKAGDRVKAGDVIALTGNTGRSTGPHLHYQLNKGSKVLDPIDYHGTERRKLPEADAAKFGQVVKAADARLDTAGAVASR